MVLVLNNIRSAYNVGSIWRSASAFGAKEVTLVGLTPYPTQKHDQRLPHISHKATKMIAKTALGAEQQIPCRYFADVKQAITYYRNKGYHIYALEQADSSTPIANLKPKTPLALVLGNEVKGLSPTVLKQVDGIIEIPMPGQKKSLNVAVAAGIALYLLSN